MPDPGRPDSRGEGTPDRLQAFRAEYQKSGRKIRAFELFLIVLLLVGFGGLALLHLVREPTTAPGASGDDSGRRLAAYLAEKNQPELALQTYEDYLHDASLADAERAKVCYSVAELALSLEDYPTALRYLYEAELFDPNSTLKTEIDKKIVLCLERLGRAETLRRELRARSGVQPTAPEGTKVLAEFAGEIITDRDLEREIERLPATVRDSFATVEQKIEFLKNLVAERLLLEKAVRLGYDQDETVQETIARQRDSLVVRMLIDNEVKESLDITDADVERFYKAEIGLFTTPASARGGLGIASTEEEAKAAASAADAQQVTLSDGRVRGANLTEQVASALSKAVLDQPGEVDMAVNVAETWYAFHGLVTPPDVKPLDAVKDRAAQMYRAQKEQELVQGLIASTLEAQNVKLYPERVIGAEEQP